MHIDMCRDERKEVGNKIRRALTWLAAQAVPVRCSSTPSSIGAVARDEWQQRRENGSPW